MSSPAQSTPTAQVQFNIVIRVLAVISGASFFYTLALFSPSERYIVGGLSLAVLLIVSISELVARYDTLNKAILTLVIGLWAFFTVCYALCHSTFLTTVGYGFLILLAGKFTKRHIVVFVLGASIVTSVLFPFFRADAQLATNPVVIELYRNLLSLSLLTLILYLYTSTEQLNAAQLFSFDNTLAEQTEKLQRVIDENKETTQQMVQLVDYLPAFMIVTDATGQIKRIDGAQTTLSTIDVSVWMGQSLIKALPSFAQFMDYDRLHDGDTLQLLAELDGRTFDTIVYPITNTDGQLTEICLICRDVSDEVAALNALEASELRLARILEQSPDHIMIVRAYDHIILYSNVPHFFGESVVGTNFFDMMARLSIDIEPLRMQWANIRTRAPKRVAPITIAIDGQGETNWLRSRPVMLTQHNNREPETVLYTISTITEQKRAELALRDSEEQLRTIYNQSLDIVLLVDQDETIIRANDAIKTLLGYEPDSLIGKPFTILLQNNENDVFSPRANLDGSSSAIPFIAKDGTVCLMELTATVITWQDTPAIIITLRDVSRQELMRHELEQARQLRELMEREHALLEDRVQMIFVIAHQLRNPLSIILSSTEILERYWSKLEVQRRQTHFDRIIQNTLYLRRMMTDMLAVRDAVLGNLEFYAQPLNLHDFCFRLINQIEAEALETHEFMFTYSLEETIFPADENLLTYILENLLANAIRYSPDGGKVTLRVGEIDENTIIISVSDQGLGIPNDAQENIFDLFYRADNASSIKGTGIGLALAFNAAKAHQGTLSVNSTLGEGSTFSLTIPKNPVLSAKD